MTLQDSLFQAGSKKSGFGRTTSRHFHSDSISLDLWKQPSSKPQLGQHIWSRRASSRSLLITPSWCPQRDSQALSHTPIPHHCAHRWMVQELSFPLPNFSGAELHCHKNTAKGHRVFFSACIFFLLAQAHPLQTSKQVKPAWVLLYPHYPAGKGEFVPPPGVWLSSSVSSAQPLRSQEIRRGKGKGFAW